LTLSEHTFPFTEELFGGYEMPSYVSSQKLGAVKTDHPLESRKEAHSFPDNYRHQATLPRNIEIIPSYNIITAGRIHNFKYLYIRKMLFFSLMQ
jgi:hypothetical protein